MSNYLQELLSEETLNQVEDMTKTTTGGGDFEPPVAKVGLARLSSYIEVGIHSKGKGAQAKDRPMSIWEFTLLSKHHTFESGEGENKKVHNHTIRLMLPISTNEGSDYIAVFSRVNYDQKAKHPIQCINKPVIVEIHHNEYEGKTYANLWSGSPKQKSWSIRGPFQENGLTGDKKSIASQVPPLKNGLADVRAFLWGKPLQEAWDALFIEGESEDKDGKKKSKNWIQNMMKEAKNFPGSPLEAMLKEGGALDNLPDGDDLAGNGITADAVAEQEDNTPDVDDALAALGL